MKHYGEYEFVAKSNEEYIDILKSIGTKDSLVLYVVDVLSVPKNLNEIKEYLIKNDIILVLNKIDLLPKSVVERKIMAYFEPYNFLDIVTVSAEKSYNIGLLLKKIKKHYNKKNVYVVGNTNAGKSTLMNKMINNYSIESSNITISPMPATTLNEIKIKFEDFYLIDTPGLFDQGNILNFVEKDMIKNLSPKKQIKPKIYQVKKGQALIIGGIIRIDYISDFENSLTLFISNDIEVKRINGLKHDYLKDLSYRELEVKHQSDIVINGLGFIKIIGDAKFEMYLDKDIEIFTRRSLI
jgi:ribosome biogenesis GTPase A